MKKKIVILLAVCTVMLSGCGKQTYSIKDEDPEIKCKTASYETIAHIDILDTYTLQDEKYYKLTFSFERSEESVGQIVTNSPLDTSITSGKGLLYKSNDIEMSETDYNKYFGASNNAFKTTIYELECDAPIVKYDVSGLRKFLNTKISSKGNALPSVYNSSKIKLAKNRWGDNNIQIFMPDKSNAIVYANEIRFSVFGQTDYSEKDKQEVIEAIYAIGNEYLDYLDEK